MEITVDEAEKRIAWALGYAIDHRRTMAGLVRCSGGAPEWLDDARKKVRKLKAFERRIDHLNWRQWTEGADMTVEWPDWADE